MFSHKPPKKTTWHIGQPYEKDEHGKTPIREYVDRWTEIPSRGKVWLNGCGGWVDYKWHRRTWKPW